MIQATLKGKMGTQEDPLTSTVFGCLRYMPLGVLIDWLETATPYGFDAVRPWASVHKWPEMVFWPSWKDTLRGKGTVEPDVVLDFGEAVVVVEAKLWSPKSLAWVDERPADQLVRQWKSGADLYRVRRGSQAELQGGIYLTPHRTLPRSDLDESIEMARREGVDRPRLYWLSWGSLGPLLLRESVEGSPDSRVVARDLLLYLDHMQLLRFMGWPLDALQTRPGAISWSYVGDLKRRYFDRFTRPGTMWSYKPRVSRYLVDITMPSLPLWRYKNG